MKFKRMIYSTGIILIMIMFLGFISYYFNYDMPIYSTIFGRQDDFRPVQGKVYDGMYANYTFDYLGAVNNSCFTYSHISGNLYNVTWDSIYGTSSWIENTQTRITSNSSGIHGVRNGRHTFLWLFTNISLGDLILITVDGVGNHLYNVTDELRYNHTVLGDIEVWVLRDIYYPSGLAFYEKSRGILVNGKFVWSAYFYRLILTSTNAFLYNHDQQSGGETPEYNLFLIVPVISIITLIVLRIRKKN